ncbi:hypothetical protein KCU66_g18026, partial [Aureobasidium melanogenum]
LDGRTSRASTNSGQSKALGPQRGTGDTLDAAAPGVLSMLKTSTDVGDVGEFSHNTGRLPAALRPNHQRRNNPSRLSNSSNHSTYTYNTNHSRIPSHGSRKAFNAHNPQGWDAVSAMSGGTGNGVSGRYGSMSTFNASRSAQIIALWASPAKSVTSLRSQGGTQFQPPRLPFAYPSRHKRPGFRTPSPALSDYTGNTYQASHNQVHTLELEPRYPTEQPSAPYGPTDPAHYARLIQTSESYQGSSSDRSYGPASGRGMHRPNMPMHNSDYSYGAAPGPGYTNQQQPMMPFPTQHNFQEPNYYGQYGPPIQSLPSLGYTPTSRVGTPGLEAMPSSSRQGSSSPPSMNPPTPRDTTTVQAMIDPNVLHPAFSELPEENFGYKSVQSYLRYTEQSTMYELDASQPAAAELEADTPTAKRTGLVQRIRNLLEDRAAGQEHLASSQSQFQQDVSKLVVPQPFQNLRQEPVELSASKRSSVHEPVELDVPPRITRQLIQANTAPSSSEHNTTTSLAPEETLKAKNDQKPIEKLPEVHKDEVHGGEKTGHGLFFNYSDNQKSGVSTQPNGAGFGARITLSEPLSTSDHIDQLKVKVDDKTKQLSEELESGGVSPLRPDEKVVRNSIVSPMATQTLHITSVQEQSKILDQHPKTTEESPHDRSS